MSMRLMRTFGLVACLAGATGCAQVENVASDGFPGVEKPQPTQECITVGRITAGCRDIVKPYNHKAPPTLPPLEEQKAPLPPGDENCVPVNEVEVSCPEGPPLPMS